MLLTIDIGNTNVVLGLFQNKKLITHLRLHTDKTLPPSQWAAVLLPLLQQQAIILSQVTGLAVASVVPEFDAHVAEFCRVHLSHVLPYWVTHKAPFHLRLDVDQPAATGTDRFVNAAMAFHKFKTDLIVIDMGTATTFDCVSAEGVFTGGVIAPGLATSAAHLFRNASRLEKIHIKKPAQVIGKNTTACLESGLFFGYLGLIETLIQRIQEETQRPMTVVMTGGLSGLFVHELSQTAHHEPFLTLEGLQLVYDFFHND